MIRIVIFAVAIATCYATTTTTTSMPMTSDMETTTTVPQPSVLFDLHHHVAVIVRTTDGASGNPGDAIGCYEYHMPKEVVNQVESGMTDTASMTAITALNDAQSVHNINHHQINHLSSDIRTMCASLPVFSFH